jgi:hypothetical protein
MPHQDMIEQSLLYYAPRADSSLQEKYQEPCVVFAGHHPSLRGSMKWGNNSNNTIIFIYRFVQIIIVITIIIYTGFSA